MTTSFETVLKIKGRTLTRFFKGGRCAGDSQRGDYQLQMIMIIIYVSRKDWLSAFFENQLKLIVLLAGLYLLEEYQSGG